MTVEQEHKNSIVVVVVHIYYNVYKHYNTYAQQLLLLLPPSVVPVAPSVTGDAVRDTVTRDVTCALSVNFSRKKLELIAILFVSVVASVTSPFDLGNTEVWLSGRRGLSATGAMDTGAVYMGTGDGWRLEEVECLMAE